MERRNVLFAQFFLLASGLLICLLPLAGQVASQTPTDAPAEATARAQAASSLPPARVREDYTIGPGDIVYLTVEFEPEASGKFRVSDSGDLVLPVLHKPIKAEGLSPGELSNAVARALADAQLLKDPMVSVFVEEYHSQTVTVLGAVKQPSVYPLQKRTTVLEVLSMAGGLLPTAGNNLTVAHERPPSEGAEGRSQETIDLGKLMEGKDPALNLRVRAGDVISVDTAAIVYVVGAVTRAGGFVVQDPKSGITVLQALAMAGGMTGVAAPKRTVLIHNTGKGQIRQKEPIDLSRLMAGKESDQLLAANDILFIPESGTKKSLSKLAEAGMQAVNGIAIYGVGYRVAGIK
jgi:polysaccharide export outer membrane protein